MNVKRWLAASAAAFVVIFGLDVIIHTKLLMGLYEQTASVWRPQHEANSLMGLMTVSQALFSAILAWFYTKGYESNKPGAGQGLRFGLYAGLLVGVPQSLVWYVVLPIPFALAVGWFLGNVVDCLAAGAVIGAIYKVSSSR